MEKRLVVIILASTVVLGILFMFWSDYQKAIRNDVEKVSLQEVYALDPAFVHDINSSEVLRKANDAARKQGASALKKASELYLKENPVGFNNLVTTKPKHISKNDADICGLLTSKYIGAIPRDPRMLTEAGKGWTGAGFVYDCNANYTTGFFISKTEGGSIIIEAPLAEFEEEIKY